MFYCDFESIFNSVFRVLESNTFWFFTGIVMMAVFCKNRQKIWGTKKSPHLLVQCYTKMLFRFHALLRSFNLAVTATKSRRKAVLSAWGWGWITATKH